MPLDEEGRPLEERTVIEEPEPTGTAEIPDLAPEQGSEAADDATESAQFVLTAPVFEAELPAPGPEPDATLSPRTRKRKLRELNSARVRTLVHRTKQKHARINAELNRMVGVARITEATVAQLEKRLETANKWLERIR